MEWDDNKDGLISWTEALEEFQKIFTSMKNEKRDHWVSANQRVCLSCVSAFVSC
jgi:hypothetical protein